MERLPSLSNQDINALVADFPFKKSNAIAVKHVNAFSTSARISPRASTSLPPSSSSLRAPALARSAALVCYSISSSSFIRSNRVRSDSNATLADSINLTNGGLV